MSGSVIDARADRMARLAASATDTPELVIDLATVRANVDRIAKAAQTAGVGVRPHVKTHKLPQIARLQVTAGAVGIQVAKLGEAQVMVDAGIDDVLVGYPIVGHSKVERLVDLAERARVTVSLDALDVAARIAASAARRGMTVGMLVELDTGLSRIGVAPGDEAVELAQRIHALPGAKVVGVLTHEGHAYSRATSLGELAALTRAACLQTVETADAIRAHGIGATTVSVGSAATFRYAVEVPGVTEARPGTYVFNDRTQVALESATPDDIAAVVVATVVSGPRGAEVVIDAGSKALTSDRMIVNGPPVTFGDVHTAAGGRGELVRLSEEHGVVAFEDPVALPRIGEQVTIVPNHICPVVNLFETATIVEDGATLDRWPVAARGKLQ